MSDTDERLEGRRAGATGMTAGTPAVVDAIARYVAASSLLHGRPDIDAATRLLGGGIDSVGLMELLSFVEEEFGITLDYEDIDEENFATVGRLALLVRRKLDEAGAPAWPS